LAAGADTDGREGEDGGEARLGEARFGEARLVLAMPLARYRVAENERTCLWP